jgi:hypothetical protein
MNEKLQNVITMASNAGVSKEVGGRSTFTNDVLFGPHLTFKSLAPDPPNPPNASTKTKALGMVTTSSFSVQRHGCGVSKCLPKAKPSSTVEMQNHLQPSYYEYYEIMQNRHIRGRGLYVHIGDYDLVDIAFQQRNKRSTMICKTVNNRSTMICKTVNSRSTMICKTVNNRSTKCNVNGRSTKCKTVNN